MNFNVLPYGRDFLKYLSDSGFNEATTVPYVTGLLNFDRYLLSSTIPWDMVDSSVVDDFFNSCTLKNSTKNVYRAGLLKYFEYLNKDFGFAMSIDSLPRFKTEKKHIKVDYSVIDVTLRMLKNCDSMNSLRDYIIIQLVIKTGIKISDLVKLKKNDWVDSQKKN